MMEPFILLAVSKHNFDKSSFGDYLLPAYDSEEELQQYHAGIPYITVTQKNNRILAIIKGIDDKNV